MAILKNQIGSQHGLKGETPSKLAGAIADSTLHKESSLNNSPEITRPNTKLGLGGTTPAKYTNPETGATI